jgi:hypothetical protein
VRTVLTSEGGRDDKPRTTRIRIDAPGFDLATHVEDIVGIFALDAAGQLASVRRDFGPRGLADASVQLSWTDDAPVTGEVRVEKPRNARLNFGNAPLRLLGDDASVMVSLHEAGATTTYRGSATEDTDGAAGKIDVAGEVASDGAGGRKRSQTSVRASDIALASRGLHAVLRDAGQVGIADALAKYAASGVIDASLSVVGEGTSPVQVAGTITPRSLAFTIEQVPVTFDEIAGEIELLGGDGGRVRGLRLQAPAWSVQGDCAWSADAKDASGEAIATSIDATFALRARSLTPDLRAVLPDAVDGALVELDRTQRGRGFRADCA